MPKKIREEDRTPLGRFVLKLRQRQPGPLTQKDFQEKVLNYKRLKGYVTKVESGLIDKNFASDFLEALARVSNETLESVRQIASAQRPQRDTPGIEQGNGATAARFKLVFGHCIWGAPIALAALQKTIKQFRVGSFFEPETASKEGAPLTKKKIQWIDDQNFEIFKSDVPGYKTYETVKSISAVDAVELLIHGLVDVIAVPGNVAQTRSGLTRIASVVDSASGCTLVYNKDFANVLRAARVNLKSKDDSVGMVFADDLAVAVWRNPGVLIGLEPGTVADVLLSKGCSRGLNALLREKVDATSAPRPKKADDMIAQIAMDWKTSDRKAPPLFNTGGHNGPRSVLTWFPQAAWLKKYSGLDLNLQTVYFPFGVDGRPEHITFDLVVRTETVNSTVQNAADLRNALVDLLAVVADCAQDLNKFSSTDVSSDRNMLRLLAWYFDLNNNDAPDPTDRPSPGILEAIGAVRFTSYLHCPFIKRLFHHENSN